MQNFFQDPIYSHSNLILLFWSLGIAGNVLLSLCKSKNLKAAVSVFWNEERLLYGDWAANQRIEIGAKLFLIAAIVIQIITFFLNSLVRENWPQATLLFKLMGQHILGACLVLKIVLCSRYSGKQLFFAWPAYFVLRWSFMNNHSYWIMMATLCIFAAKDIPLKKTLQKCLWTSFGSVMLVFLGVAVQIIPIGQLVMEDGRVRYGIGYGSPNLLGAYLLGMLVMYACYRGVKKLNWWDLLLFGAVALFCDWVPKSRGASIAILALTIGLCVAKCFPKLFEYTPVQILAALSPAAVFGMSYWMHAGYSTDNPLFVWLNSMLTGRLALGSNAMYQFPVKIMGQMVPEESAAFVDNIHVFFWLAAGPIASVLLWGAFGVLIWKLIKKGAITEVVCIGAFLAHSLVDRQILWPSVNVLLWLLAAVFYWTPCKQFPTFTTKNCSKEN